MATTSTIATATAPALDLAARIDQLLRYDGGEFASFVATVERDLGVPGTLARMHCNVICLDGDGNVRLRDLARWLAFQVIDYAIPRQEILDARAWDERHNTSRRMAELNAKARLLFTRISGTGEGGELLLYVLAQAQLKIPQLFCKMPHKTNPNVHVHGVDGIHVGLDASTGRLALYWGESKLHGSVANAVSEALASIKPFVCREGGSGTPYERDLQLMRDNIDLADPTLEAAILRFLDRDDPQHNEVHFRGVCLVGFDHTCYPTAPNQKQIDALMKEARDATHTWLGLLERQIKSRPPLSSIHLEVFLMPFPSVEDFRQAFLRELQHG